jgi:hypothetical protein
MQEDRKLRSFRFTLGRPGLFLMKLPAAHEAPGNIGGLQSSTLGRRMGGKIAGDGDQDVPALAGVAPLPELAHGGFQHLIGVKARVLAQQRSAQRGDKRSRRVAECEMACHEKCREVDLPLPVEGIEQSGSESLDIGGQTVEEVGAVAGDARWRHVQIAGEIERHRAVQNAAYGLGVAVRVGSAPRGPP